MLKMQSQRDDQLRRKLELLLGTIKGIDWLTVYAEWAAHVDIGDTDQLYDDRHVQMFVQRQRNAQKFSASFKTLDDLVGIVGIMRAPGESDESIRERMRLKLEGKK